MHQIFMKKFNVPEAGKNVLDAMFSPDQILFVENLDRDEFTIADILEAGLDEEFEKEAYHQGLISLTGESRNGNPLYSLNSFYGALDVFVVSRQDIYRTFPEETRLALDEWYFQAYLDGLDPDLNAAPTKDAVLSLQQTLDLIENEERTPYLNYCDCRSLRGDCGLPTRTCVTFRSGINTFAHRGHSVKLSKEEAKDVIRMADKAGLMHTANPNGICNCCSDCCYLFRAQKARNSSGIWPVQSRVAHVDQEKCVGCTKCQRACHLDAITVEFRKAAVNYANCVGCDVCARVCPTQAISMEGLRV